MINFKRSIPSSLRARIVLSFVALVIVATLSTKTAQAQESLKQGDVIPMGQWLEFKQTDYTEGPILVHLRTGYERAVLMPEPVRLQSSDQQLPGCEIMIDGEVVGYYPTLSFERESLKFVGLDSGTVYELLIRASALGMRQPLQINLQTK